MRAVFASRRNDAGGLFERAALWLETIPDLLTNAVAVQWDVLRHDLRYAARALGRSPGFAVTAIAIAGIGIGATTAAFTMVDHVLIRPLPFPQQDRLVKLREDDLSGLGRFWSLARQLPRLERMSTSYESMGAFHALSINMTGGQGDPQRLDGGAFTAEVFPPLGVQPALGRVFTAEDDRDAAPGTVILSYGLWQEQFGGDPAVLGARIQLDDAPYTIIGVMPNGFYFPTREARLWTADALASRHLRRPHQYLRVPGGPFETRCHRRAGAGGDANHCRTTLTRISEGACARRSCRVRFATMCPSVRASC